MQKEKIIKKLLKYWPILVVALCAFILRIWHIEDLFYFTYDESIPAFVGRRLILWHHIPLIGGVTPFNFHLGPYFYWFYAILLFIGKLNPIIWGIASAMLASATIVLAFILGRELQGKKLGFTIAALWTFSTLANIYDRHLWALFWGPLISLITLISLIKILKGDGKYTFLLAITLALGIHADPSNLIFVGLAILVWIIYKIPIKKSALLGIMIIILSFLPLVVFDLKHNFSNTRPVLDFIKQGRNKPGFQESHFLDNMLLFPKASSRLAYVFGDNEAAKQYSYCKAYVEEKFQAVPSFVTIASGFIILGFIAWSFTKNKNVPWRLVSLLVILYYIGIQIYGTFFKADIFEHYLAGLFPAFLLILAKVIASFPRRIWMIVLAIFIAANLYKLMNLHSSIGLKNKREAIEYTMREVRDRPFSLDSLSTCWKYNGYRYLFAVFGREPVKSYVDPNFAYLYGTTQVAEKHPQTVVSFVVHDFVPETQEFYNRYTVLKSHQTKSATFGNLEVIILDNSTEWFDK